MGIRQSSLMAVLLFSVIHQTAVAEVELTNEQHESLPLFLESRLYAGDTSAFGTTLNTQAWGWVFKAGGIVSFGGLENDSDVDLEFGVTRPFVFNDDLTMGLGIGAVGSDFFADYSLSYAVSKRVSITTGYRFNFIDSEDNRNQLFLGANYTFGAAASTVSVPAPELADVNLPSDNITPSHDLIAVEPFTLAGQVNFASNSYLPLNIMFLDDVVEQWISYPHAAVSVIGYADSSGNQADNLKLSEARANFVVVYLVEQGMSPLQINKVVLGDADPLVSNSTINGRAQNRRVEVTLIAK
ncbi:MAG: OmpA family protein [Shewanella sp.]